MSSTLEEIVLKVRNERRWLKLFGDDVAVEKFAWIICYTEPDVIFKAHWEVKAFTIALNGGTCRPY